MCYQKKHAYSKPRRPKVHQLQAGIVYVHSNMSHDHLDDDYTANDSFSLHVMIKSNQKKEQRVPRPTHLITNLVYRLQTHHCRNLYLRPRLVLCNPKFICKNNWYFALSSIYFLYPLTSLPKMVKQEMPASIKQS